MSRLPPKPMLAGTGETISPHVVRQISYTIPNTAGSATSMTTDANGNIVVTVTSPLLASTRVDHTLPDISSCSISPPPSASDTTNRTLHDNIKITNRSNVSRGLKRNNSHLEVSPMPVKRMIVEPPVNRETIDLVSPVSPSGSCTSASYASASASTPRPKPEPEPTPIVIPTTTHTSSPSSPHLRPKPKPTPIIIPTTTTHTRPPSPLSGPKPKPTPAPTPITIPTTTHTIPPPSPPTCAPNQNQRQSSSLPPHTQGPPHPSPALNQNQNQRQSSSLPPHTQGLPHPSPALNQNQNQRQSPSPPPRTQAPLPLPPLAPQTKTNADLHPYHHTHKPPLTPLPP
ncbi:hypothetical protein BDQ17DRAFT_1430818 [Cyathus striatus]|nr:hypothetical protein BDQ17DRAFT_1430818 [Cyathus striatus]